MRFACVFIFFSLHTQIVIESVLCRSGSAVREFRSLTVVEALVLVSVSGFGALRLHISEVSKMCNALASRPVGSLSELGLIRLSVEYLGAIHNRLTAETTSLAFRGVFSPATGTKTN